MVPHKSVIEGGTPYNRHRTLSKNSTFTYAKHSQIILISVSTLFLYLYRQYELTLAKGGTAQGQHRVNVSLRG